MSALERALARLSLHVVSGIEEFWKPCARCGSVRWPWHQHQAEGQVVQLVRAERGGDVA